MRAVVVAGALVAACDYPPLAATADGPMGDGKGPRCDAPTSFGSPTLTVQSAHGFPGDRSHDNELDVIATIDAADRILLLAWDNNSSFPDFTHFHQASVNLAGSNLQTCPACVMVAAKCNASCDPSTGSGVGSYYFATAGTLQLDTVDPNATGSLSNLTLAHATIDFGSGIVTFANDGCATTIARASFNTAVL
jgi:hypothetical protein